MTTFVIIKHIKTGEKFLASDFKTEKVSVDSKNHLTFNKQIE